jgi:thiamine-phosphate diphosphorylase
VSLPRPCVCLVTDRSRLAPQSEPVTDPAFERLPDPAAAPVTDSILEGARLGPLADRLVLAAEAGVDLLQIREPDLSPVEMIDLIRGVRARLGDAPARLIVNERVDVALAADADGVHLKADSIPTALVRRQVPAGFLVGRSVHAIDEARAAADEGADYVIFGTVFTSGSKPRGHRTAGVEGLAAVSRAVGIPVLAIGGISLNTVATAAEAGAAGVAALGLFFDAVGPMDDLRSRLAQTVAGLRRPFRSP